MTSHAIKRIALTVGDPAGIGPELALQAAAQWSSREGILLVIGHQRLLQRVAQRLHLPCPTLVACSQLDALSPGAYLVQPHEFDAEQIQPGRWSALTGGVSYAWVCYAIEAAMHGEIDAIVTGPIQKEAWHASGVTYPGHTELLADMTSTLDFRMMLTSSQLSCVLATIHIPLGEVAKTLTTEDVYSSIRLGHLALSKLRGRPARVSVCGLNPHAGENGLFSHGEEEHIIKPAIERARAEGIEVVGPLAPDTAFVPARRAATDVYVCMYHDQGLIPLKAISFDEGVNVTLGLPIVRTSVDHGTAMDIAWQGKASGSSLQVALQLAQQLA